MRARQVFFSFFAIAWLVGLAGCSGIGTSVGISVPIGRAGGVGVSVGSGGAVSGSVGVGSGGGSLSVGTSGQLPKKTEPGEEKKEDNK